MDEALFKKMEQDREECLNRILISNAPHKIIVAGPGTGKTHTFKELLQAKPGKSLILTLIINLIDDMKEKLGNLADVRTFHSFAIMILKKYPFGGISHNFLIYPKLNKIISKDTSILHKSGDIDNDYKSKYFDKSFCSASHNEAVKIFLELSNYYDSVGFDDSVYRVLKLFEHSESFIPKYHHVMVDEYQDFNQLEVNVLSKLESCNNTLIVGDDDQSIYNFRQASPEYLRNKWDDKSYVQFLLPYSSRCTPVVISAVTNIIKEAQKKGLLLDRVKKEFKCYLPEKHHDDITYPKIIRANVSVNYPWAPFAARYIQKIISNVPKHEIEISKEKNYPLALIVGPKHYLPIIYATLNQHFKDVNYLRRQDKPISLLDGYGIIFEKPKSNLGWRILIQPHLNKKMYQEYIIRMYRENIPLFEILPTDFIEERYQTLNLIKKLVKSPTDILEEEIVILESETRSSLSEIIEYFTGPIGDENFLNCKNDDLEPKIILTNFNGCKGIDAGYTFITGLDKGMFPKDVTPTETEICQFIVALTRTRKQCHLIHIKRFQKNVHCPSPFFSWIPDNLLELVNVNKYYF